MRDREGKKVKVLLFIQGSDKVLRKIFPDFLPIFKASFPERCLDLGTFFPE